VPKKPDWSKTKISKQLRKENKMSDNQLSTIVNQAGLAENKSKQLLANFADLFNDAKQTVKFAKDISVTDVSQIEEMEKARKTRLELKSTRVQVEKTRKELKEQSLREGKAIDGIANVIKALIVPVEQYLEDQEKFAERLEAERKNKIEADRVSRLSKYIDEAESYSLHPDKMSQDTFDKLLENSRIAFEAKKKAEEDAERERIAREKAEREEQERIRKENARLKAEAEAREKELAKERAEQQAKLEAERKARLELEEKARKEKEAEEARLKAEAEKQRQSLLAPDKDKLIAFAEMLSKIEKPALKESDAQKILNNAITEIGFVVDTIKRGVESL